MIVFDFLFTRLPLRQNCDNSISVFCMQHPLQWGPFLGLLLQEVSWFGFLMRLCPLWWFFTEFNFVFFWFVWRGMAGARGCLVVKSKWYLRAGSGGFSECRYDCDLYCAEVWSGGLFSWMLYSILGFLVNFSAMMAMTLVPFLKVCLTTQLM